MTVPCCLHGLPGGGRVWDGVAAALGGSHRVVAPDLPGLGAGARPLRPRDLGDIAASTEEMLAELALPKRFVLVMHDVGALFGLAWAVERPQRPAALVVLNAGVFGDRRWHWGARLLRTPGLGALLVRALPRAAFARELRRASAGGIDAATAARLHADFPLPARQTARHLYRLQGPRLFTGFEVRVRALAAAVPSLVLWGERNPYLPGSFAARFGAAQVRRYPDLGHWPHVEAPGRLAADLEGFMAAQGLRAV